MSAYLTLFSVLVIQATSRVCSSTTYSLTAAAPHAVPQDSPTRMVGLVTATQRMGDKPMVWQRSIASARPAELLNIDMAEARAEQHDGSTQEACEASKASMPVESWPQVYDPIPFGALVLLNRGSVVACSLETAQAMLACAEHGCSAELHGNLAQSPAPRAPWQLQYAGACLPDERMPVSPSKLSKELQGRPQARANTLRHVITGLAALCCVQLVALLVLLRCGAAVPACAAARQPLLGALMSPVKSVTLYHTPCAGASPVHSSAMSQRSCRPSFHSSGPNSSAGLSGDAFSGRPRATGKVVRRLHFSDAEQAATIGVRWERTGARLERAAASCSGMQHSGGLGREDEA